MGRACSTNGEKHIHRILVEKPGGEDATWKSKIYVN
jgi:hypothetical protein